MSSAFVIEIEGDAAGLALAERSGFRFYASTRAYWELEGQWFGTLRQAERAAAVVERRRAAAARRAPPARPEQCGDRAVPILGSDAARSGAALPDGAWGMVLERYLRGGDRTAV
jgi:hypothetical protein